MTKEEIVAFLNSKEGKKAMGASAGTLEDLVTDIEITDTDTPESIGKKMNAQLKQIAKSFQEQLTAMKSEVVEEATLPARQSKQQEILNFKKTHPGMSNDEVISIMDPLYISGKTLEEAYAIACKSLELNPTTGVPLSEETKGGKDEKPAPKKPEVKKSLKSDIPDDEDTDVGTDKKEAKTLSDIIKANANKLDAESDPFK